MIPQPKVVWELDALLGEGPAWCAREAALWFVDIKRGRLHRYHPGTGARTTLEVGGNPSFIVPLAGGGWLTGSRSGIYAVKDETLGKPLAVIDQPDHNRTNDATVDAAGRLWIATMDDEEQVDSGTLWCLDQQGLQPAGTRAVVANGPAVSDDVKMLYRVDSGARTIFRHLVGADGKLLGQGEVFVQMEGHEGHPDGVVLDAQDCLWVGLWDGWGVRRYAPDGSLLLHVPLPCARVTKLAFGGPDLMTAYVTTARIGLADDELAGQPFAGSLFSFRAPAPGRPLPAVKLPATMLAEAVSR